MGNTYEKVKEGFKNAAGENAENEKGGKEPMNPEDIAGREPTAVKRDKNQGSSGDPI